MCGATALIRSCPCCAVTNESEMEVHSEKHEYINIELMNKRKGQCQEGLVHELDHRHNICMRFVRARVSADAVH